MVVSGVQQGPVVGVAALLVLATCMVASVALVAGAAVLTAAQGLLLITVVVVDLAVVVALLGKEAVHLRRWLVETAAMAGAGEVSAISAHQSQARVVVLSF